MQRQTKDQTPASRLEPRHLSSSILGKAGSYPRALAWLFPLNLFVSQKTNPAVKCFQESSEARHLRGKNRLPSAAIQVSFCSVQATTMGSWSAGCPATPDRCLRASGGSCSHRDCPISLNSTDAKSRWSLSTILSEISVSPVLALVRSWLGKVQLKRQI